MDKFLIIKTSALGDIVHVFPTLDYLSKKFPQAQIDWVVEAPYAELLQAHPAINRLFLIHSKEWRKNLFSLRTWRAWNDFRKQLRAEEYDAVFDLQGNIKSGLILSQARGRKKVGFGSKTVSEWPNLLFTNHKIDPPPQNICLDYLGLVARFFSDENFSSFGSGEVHLRISEEQQQIVQKILSNPLLSGPRVVVCPGSAWRNKQLSLEQLSAFLKLVQEALHCSFLLAWGNPQELETAQALQKQLPQHAVILEKVRLPTLQHLMQQCDLVIAMDSLPLHLAGTTSTPTYSIFGPSLAEKFRPLGEHHAAFQGSCPYGRKFEKRCPILRTCSTGACIRSIDAHELFTHFHSRGLCTLDPHQRAKGPLDSLT